MLPMRCVFYNWFHYLGYTFRELNLRLSNLLKDTWRQNYNFWFKMNENIYYLTYRVWKIHLKWLTIRSVALWHWNTRCTSAPGNLSLLARLVKEKRKPNKVVNYCETPNLFSIMRSILNFKTNTKEAGWEWQNVVLSYVADYSSERVVNLNPNYLWWLSPGFRLDNIQNSLAGFKRTTQ